MLKCQLLYCWHFNIYEHDEFHAQMSRYRKKFYNKGPGLFHFFIIYKINIKKVLSLFFGSNNALRTGAKKL